ncbi:hypothetical protein PoHVEF18_000487 [Penicillium ochrochloron]
MSSHGKPISRIAIIGVGQVGAAAAYAIILHSLASELLLVDIKTQVRNGQINDLSDVSYSCNSKTRVRAATHQEARHSDIVVITAGSKYSTDTILLVVANPVDLLTSLAHELSDLPASQVLGSGTFLDSVRIRNLLAETTGVAANSIDLYVVGVHGDSQVVAWSDATIAGIPINESLPLSTLSRDELSNSICSSILSDKRNVRPISHFQPEWGCCFSLPVVLGRAGVIKKIQMPLDNDERAALDESVKDLRTKFERINEDQ